MFSYYIKKIANYQTAPVTNPVTLCLKIEKIKATVNIKAATGAGSSLRAGGVIAF